MPSPISWPVDIEYELIEPATGFLENASQKPPVMAQQEESINPREITTVTSVGLSDTKRDGGPDIDWVPSFENFMARVGRLSKTQHVRTMALPPGFPERIEAPRAWAGQEFSEEKSYIYVLSEAEVKEIEEALDYFKALPGKLGPAQVSKETFPLPMLGEKLEDVSKELHFGRGFAILRGLEPKQYTPLDNVIIYTGVTSYIAETRGCQDNWGNMMIHIKDVGNKIASSEERQSPYANGAQPFHTDLCDILAMYVVERASDGGDSSMASTAKVYNDIAAARPDVIHTLANDSWIFDKFQKPALWHTRPLLFNDENQGPFFCFSRRVLTGSLVSPRTSGIPAMTEEQAEALDTVHFTAEKNSLSVQLKRGDMQFLNNFSVFHARRAFTDDEEETGRKRHILRLWLRNEKYAWKTPDRLKDSWLEVYGESERMGRACWMINPNMEKRQVVSRRDTCLHG